MRQDVLNQLNIIGKGGDFVNKSAIARMMDCDPRTVKRYLDGYVPSKKRKRKLHSKLDDFKSTIISKLELGCSGMAIFKFIQKSGYNGSYSLLEEFIKKHKDEQTKKATIRFETCPGQQAQVDWKENLKIVSKSGEVFDVNFDISFQKAPNNFDSEFTNEAARDSFTSPVFGPLMNVRGFAYMSEEYSKSTESIADLDYSETDTTQSNDYTPMPSKIAIST